MEDLTLSNCEKRETAHLVEESALRDISDNSHVETVRPSSARRANSSDNAAKSSLRGPSNWCVNYLPSSGMLNAVSVAHTSHVFVLVIFSLFYLFLNPVRVASSVDKWGSLLTISCCVSE